MVTGRIGTGYTEEEGGRGRRKSVESRWRPKFFLVSSVRAGLGFRKKKRNGWLVVQSVKEEKEEVSAREVTRN